MARKDERITAADVTAKRGRAKQTTKDKVIATFRDNLIIRALDFFAKHPDGAKSEAKNRGITNAGEASRVNAEFTGFYNAMIADRKRAIEMRKIRKGEDLRDAMAQYISAEDLEAFGLDELDEEEEEEGQKEA